MMMASSGVRPSVVVRHRPPFSKIFSKTAKPIKTKLEVKPQWEGERKHYINGPGHMNNMVKPFKIFFFQSPKALSIDDSRSTQFI